MTEQTAFFNVSEYDNWIFESSGKDSESSSHARRVVRIDSDGVKKVYPSGQEAARKNGMSSATISGIIRKERPNNTGYEWRFVADGE